MKPLTSPTSPSLPANLASMANRSYLPAPHRLLPGFSHLATSRSAVVTSSGRSSPPEFAYDAYPRESTRAGGPVRDPSAFGRAPTSPGNSSLGMAYAGVQEFPYGLSGVQMPTYNFGSELYNYVSNGFPRKSRMCSYCNKVFTRSTTRRYHEKRCPLLRASNSLAKNEENNSANSTIAAAMKEQQQQQQQQQHHQQQQHPKESPGGMQPSKPSPLLPRTLSSSITNTTSAQAASIPHTSPSLPSLHPAYPTSFPTSSTLSSNPSRANLYSGYPHSYRSHFYNSISAAALASLDQNSNKQESDNASWGSSSPPPGGKSTDRDQDRGSRDRRPSDGGSSASNALGSSLMSGALPLSKAFTSEAAVDLTARYCADFSIRSRPPVFPASSLRAHPPSPPSPELDENKGSGRPGENGDRSNCESPDVVVMEGRAGWPPSQGHDKVNHYGRSPTSDLPPRTSSSPPPGMSAMWESKTGIDPVQGPYMQVAPLDEEDEEDLDEEEDEEEMEEDEEQFKSASPLNSVDNSEGGGSLRHKSTTYNPLICQFCKKIFSDVIARKAHEALHTQKKSFTCSLCSHSFHCAYSLRIHTLRHHKQPPYKCKYCLNSYELPSSLKSHLLKQHSLPQCEQQSLKYFNLLTGSTSPPLDSMIKTAVSDGEQERYSTGLLPHQHRRSADNLPDTIAFNEEAMKSRAGSEFNEASAINDNACGGRDAETETCKICNKAFAKSFIRFHERAHADQKPYECPICNKRFGYKNNMKSHMKLHQGLKPYQCQICGARFTRGSTLRRHGRRHNISRNSMLDFVLYDHSAGPSRAMGVVGPKVNMSLPNNTLPDGVPPFSHTHKSGISDAQGKGHGLGSTINHLPTVSVSNGFDTPRYNASSKQSPSQLSPPQLGTSPRVPNNHLSSQNMANSMVGNLAAVAAANLFAYPGAAAAPHLYQFYASTNPLMGYSSYPSTTPNKNAPVVQSDALNLSLGKRRSPFTEKEEDKKKNINTSSRLESVIVGGDNGPFRNHDQRLVDDKLTKVKVETEEMGDTMTKREAKNPFTPYSTHKAFHGEHMDKDFHEETPGKVSPFFDSKDHLKLSTEDFGAQVNICCPSPQVQSSSSGSVNHGSTGSPVGSSSGPDGHIQAQASPGGMSQSSSPLNSASSPANLTEGHIQNLLVSLITSGRLFRCSFCDIYFTEYAMFRLHQKYHQCDLARPFLCAVCGEDCKDKTYFTVHLSEHLGLGTKAGLP